MRTIRIKQETPIPGTDYILEAGDRIRVNPAKSNKKRIKKESALNWIDMESILLSYIEAVVWTEEERWKEENPNIDFRDLSMWDLPEETEKVALNYIKTFIRAVEKEGVDFLNDLPQVVNRHNLEEMIGHDLWLTQNGHGVGFSDRDYNGYEDTLYRVASGMGEVYAEIGDDGKLYIS